MRVAVSFPGCHRRGGPPALGRARKCATKPSAIAPTIPRKITPTTLPPGVYVVAMPRSATHPVRVMISVMITATARYCSSAVHA